MKIPDLTAVESRNLQAIGFSNHGLFVQFKGGAVYRYPDAKKAVFDSGLEAQSKGKWFREHVRDKLKHLPVDAEPKSH